VVLDSRSPQASRESVVGRWRRSKQERERGAMGNPIYAVPKSKSEFTHVYIQLRVRDQSGSDVYFKMKRRLPLGLLQDAYCQREQLDLSKLCFLYKGRRIIPDETPEELDMEQVVTVDVVKLD